MPFWPEPQLAHLSDSWGHLPVIGALLLAAFATLIGLIGGLFGFSIYLFCKRKQRNRVSWSLFTFTSLAFMGAIGFSLVEVVGSHGFAMQNAYFALCSKYVEANGGGDGGLCAKNWGFDPDASPAMRDIVSILQLGLPLLSDGIIVHRTTKIVRSTRLAKVLWATWATTLCIALGAAVVHGRHPDPWSYAFNCISYAFIVSSTCCNLIATTATGVRLWNHWKFIRVDLGLRKLKRSRSQKVLVLLIESGSIYCVIQIAYIIIMTWNAFKPNTERTKTLNYVFQTIFSLVSGLYPALISLFISIQSIYPEAQSLSILNTIEKSHSV